MAVTRAPRGGVAAGARSTFASEFTGRRNSYGLLRLVFALGVVVAHTVPVGGFFGGRDVLTPRSRVNLGVACVYGFFTLSGVLITRSAQRTGTARFLWHRLLRILPGFWATLLGTALVCAPLAYAHQHGSLTGFPSAPDGPVAYLRAGRPGGCGTWSPTSRPRPAGSSRRSSPSARPPGCGATGSP